MKPMNQYDITFAGQINPAIPRDQVQANLARLFQTDLQRIQALFSGLPRTLKKGLDRDTAEKYREALAKAGAIVNIEESTAAASTMEQKKAPSATSAPTTERQLAPLTVHPRDQYMAAFTDVQAPDFGLLPLGSDLADATPEPTPPALDISGMELTPLGSSLTAPSPK